MDAKMIKNTRPATGGQPPRISGEAKRPPSESDAERFASLVDGAPHAGASETAVDPALSVNSELGPDSVLTPGSAAVPAFGGIGDVSSGRMNDDDVDGGRPKAREEGMADLFGQAARNLAGATVQPPPRPDGGAPAAGGVEPSAAAANQSRCEELVERILVSQPRGDGSSEVRVTLDRDWLPDTEVRLVRASGGELSVEFVSDSLESQRFLMPNLSSLRDRLTDRIGDPVNVRMSEHMDSGGDTGDGRSRNRRNLYEEYGKDGE